MKIRKQDVYLEVAQTLREKILQNEYTPNEMLPSDYKLAKHFGVSRLTVRKAIDFLIQEGLLVKEPGKGTYIMQRQSDRIQSGRGGLQSFTEAARHYGLQATSKVVTFETTHQLDSEIEAILHLQETDYEAYEIKRIRYAGNDAMTVENIFFNKKYAPLLTENEIKQSIYDVIEQTITIAYSHQEVEALLVDEETSKLLDIPVGQPIFLIHSTAFAATGEVVLYDTSFYRADKYTLKHTLHREANKPTNILAMKK